MSSHLSGLCATRARLHNSLSLREDRPTMKKMAVYRFHCVKKVVCLQQLSLCAHKTSLDR